jgi:serine/threonine protein phosphatase PrpC
MHIGISPRIRLRPRDTVVLASDGLFDNLRVSTFVEALRSGALEPSLVTVARDCRQRMTDGGHADDLTIIAMRGTARAALVEPKGGPR